MQVKYKVSFTDYEKAVLAINHNIPIYGKAKFTDSLIIAIFLFLILPFSSYILRSILTFAFFLLIYYYLFDLGINFILKRILHQKSEKKGDQFPKEVTLDVDENRFVYTSIADEYDEEFSIPWVKITAAAETEKMYVLYTSIFSTFYIVKKDSDVAESPNAFNQKIKGIFDEYYIST